MTDVVPFRHRQRRKDTTAYVGMIIFLGTWFMMFAGLFFAYGEVRLKNPMWPPPDELRLPVLLPALNTALLLLSSITLGLGVRAIKNAQLARLPLWIWTTLLGGVAFLGLQLVVWRAVWIAGLTPQSSIYGSVFYALTCFHALHVLVGLVGLAALLPRAHRGVFTAGEYVPVRLWAMYWHFVDAIWLFMFVTVYLI